MLIVQNLNATLFFGLEKNAGLDLVAAKGRKFIDRLVFATLRIVHVWNELNIKECQLKDIFSSSIPSTMTPKAKSMWWITSGNQLSMICKKEK